ncbi:hypothetical protein PF010_g2317 [Phytophthora fragariae]|uniref:Uncharacterized protein n=2 Tax=Phytophthora fragariae TaxID=53985 RepID=A0A6G0LYX5_9STRA|nr:hypothetical protein PF010_g2317 [Phytophthora fragariae]
MVVLVARKEHLDGLGRLLYKWLDAQDAWWCVFLLDTLEATCWASAHYWEGLHVESARTADLAGILVWTVWAVLTVSLYALSVCVLFVYETVEGICQGWLGVLDVLSVVNFLFCGDEGLAIAEGVALNRTVVDTSVGVVLVGCASRLWYLFETDEPSPLDRIEGGLTGPGTVELPDLDAFFMKVQLIVNTEVLVAHLCAKVAGSKCPGYEKDELCRNFKTGKSSKARLLHYFALSEEQIAAKKEVTSLEDSFAWCGWHSYHDALIQAVLTDSTGATVPNPDPQAGLLGQH